MIERRIRRLRTIADICQFFFVTSSIGTVILVFVVFAPGSSLKDSPQQTAVLSASPLAFAILFYGMYKGLDFLADLTEVVLKQQAAIQDLRRKVAAPDEERTRPG